MDNTNIMVTISFSRRILLHVVIFKKSLRDNMIHLEGHLVQVFHCGGKGFDSRPVLVILVYGKKWHFDSFFCGYFGFPVSVSSLLRIN
jgi:hypothetical protein